MKEKTIGILQPVYIPWLGYFEQISQVDLFVILDDVQYTKQAWRNRNRIRTRKGWSWLTVPVYQKGQFGQLINEAKIDNSKKWARRHSNCLRENYYHSTFWSTYSLFFEDLFREKWLYLVDLNMEIILFCVKALGINTEIVRSSSLGLGKGFQKRYGDSGNVTEKNIYYLKELGGKRFYEGALGRNYLDIFRFSNAGIQVIFQDYKHPVYEQLFKPFIPYLSIVDALFNNGPQTKNLL